MLDLEPDPARKLLTLRYHGIVTAAEASAQVEALREAFDTMAAGFSLLVDFTPLISMEPGCALSIAATMDYANTRGIASVVRVIPDPQRDIGMNILSRFHYGPDVATYTCDTMAEAIQLLFE